MSTNSNREQVIVPLGVLRLCGWPPTEHRAVFQPPGSQSSR